MNDEIRSLIQNFVNELSSLLENESGSNVDKSDYSLINIRDKLRKEGLLTGNRHCEVCDQWY